MKKLFLLLAVSFLIISISYSQSNLQKDTLKSRNHILLNLLNNYSVPQHRTCGTMENLQMEIAADPARGLRLKQIDRDMDKWIQTHQDYLNNSKTIITIPVVVHILYNTTAQNLSDTQINSQIDVLNQDYRNTNADGSSTPSIFQSLRADCEVEFCLASVDPNGDPTTGITRTQTSNTSFSNTANDAKFTSQGGIDAWDRNKYLNLWVCPLGGGLLGYAQFPGGTANTDGVVILSTAFGNIGTAASPYNKGRTATHEIGHWLNLYHIWGDDAGACTGDDQVADTPNSADCYYGCPSFPQTSCSTSNMFMNYMDYVDDACMYLFTLGQKARVVAALNGPRASILTSNGCQSSGAAPVADFIASATTITAGSSVNFTDLSTNNPSSWSWTFTGGTPATSTTQNPSSIVYNTAGTYTVTLTATNSFGSNTNTKTSYITVTAGAPPVADFIANVTTIPVGGSVNFTDLSTNNPTSWSWSFTGGTPATSTIQNPTGITYNTAGTYTVTLTATNSIGSDIETKTNYITVDTGSVAPVADFIANVTTIPVGGSVNFTDLTANLPTGWSWTFTGGTPATSTMQNPANIVYNTAGTYDVSLTATNAAGSNTKTKTLYITVSAGGVAPTADFSGSPTTISVGGSVNFTDLSTNFPTSWNWSFVGGTPASSTSQNPSGITYSTAGSYPVTLTVSNAFGTDGETKNAYIYVSNGSLGLCDTLNYPLNGSLALYQSPSGYYATGTNEYRDKAKAQYFDIFSPYYRIMGGIFSFGAASGSGSATIKVWDNSGANGTPGTPYITQTVPVSNIISNVSNNQYTYVMFDNPAIALSPFYMGVMIPNTLGDTLAVKSNATGQGGNPIKAWEQWSNDSWHNFSVAWGGNLNVKLGIFPIICMSTGIEEQHETELVSIYPNPAHNMITIDFIKNVPEDLKIYIYNSLGNLVKTMNREAFNTNKAEILLDGFSSGIYYISIHTNKSVFNDKITVIK